MPRSWTNGSGLALSAANLNALEADVTTALGVPDAALASRVQAGATRTALDGRYAKTTDLATKEPVIAPGGIDEFLRGDKTWVPISFEGATGADQAPREAIMDPTNVWGPDGTKLTIPTHVTPAGGETTHPSVVFVPEGWNGYKYWMAHTPYPAGNDDHEDPNIVASHDGITWEMPPGVTNPLADTSGTPYHSDVDLVMGPNNTMYLFFRWYSGAANGGTEERILFTTSTDGTNWTVPVNAWVNDMAVRRPVSPSFIYEDGAWTMYYVDLLPTPNAVFRTRSASTDPTSTWGEPIAVGVGTMQSGKEPWHISVEKIGGRYYGLLNDCTTGASGSNGDLLFISSGDGLTFTNSGATVIPRSAATKHDNLYRATMVPTTEGGDFGFRVWYSAWLTTGPVWNIFTTFIGEGRWKALTLQNAWVNYTAAGGYSTTGMRYKKKNKETTLEGAVKSGALSTVICTLPADAAPLNTCMWPINANGAVGMIQIIGRSAGSTQGQVVYFLGAAAPGYVPIHIKFDND